MHPNSIPAVIGGKYRVERVLGEGGMGFVVEATHLSLGTRVAIKMLHLRELRSPEAVARFLREGQAAAKLSSPHVARVLDVGQTENGEPYLVMEHLVGQDLDAEIRTRGPLPIREAVDLVLQACVGLSEAHAKGLVHRDIKPGNLFVVRRAAGAASLLKILDFGLSKMSEPHLAMTQSATAFGTPQYMSPEQTRSTKYVDARSDQHAIALVLYELLTAVPAFEAESATAALVDVAVKVPPRVRVRRPDAPSALDAAIARGLAKVPTDRFADLAAFARAIAPFGGPHAKELAAAADAELHPSSQAALWNEATMKDPNGALGPGAESALPTRKYRPAPHSQGPLTTDSDPSVKGRSWALPLALGLAFAAAFVIAFVSLSRPAAPVAAAHSNSAPADSAAPSATATVEVAPPPTASNTGAVVSPGEPVPTTPDPSASSSAASTGAQRVKAPPAGPPRAVERNPFLVGGPKTATPKQQNGARSVFDH